MQEISNEGVIAGIKEQSAGSAISSGTVIFSASNNLTISQNNQTILFSVPTPVKAFGVSDTAGNTTGTGTVVLVAGGNITLNQETAAGGQTITIAGATAGGSGGGIGAISASGNWVSDGTVIFSNSNNVSFGMSGSTVTASAAGGGGGGISGIAAGSQTGTSGTVFFSNANNVSFGMDNNSVITGSIPAIPSAYVASLNASSGQLSISGGDNVTVSNNNSTIIISAAAASAGIGGIAASNTTYTSGTVVFSNANNVSFGTNGQTITASASYSQSTAPSAFVFSGNTAGTMATITSGTVTLAGGNNITLSQNGNAVTILAANAATALALSAGTQSANTGTVVFSNSNGLAFGMSDNSVITGSYTQSIAPSGISVGTLANFTSGTVLLSASNNITLSTTTNATGNQVVLLSVPSQSIQTQNMVSVQGSTGDISFANANNVTFGFNNSTITASASMAQSTQPYNILAAGTQTANTTGSVVLSNSNNVSFGMNNSSVITASASYSQSTAPSGIAVNALTTYTSGNVVFSNANNVTFGTNGQTITASASFNQTVQPAITGIAGSGASTVTTGLVQFANANNVSFGLNSNTMTASIPSGATATGNLGGIAASGIATTFSTGTVQFSAGNLISMSTAAQAIIISNLLSSATTVSAVGTANAIGAMASRFALEGHQHAGVAGIVASGTASTFIGNAALSAGSLIALSTGGNTTAGSIAIHNLLSSATTVSQVASANAIGAMASRFALEGHQHAGVAAFGASNTGNTLGNTGTQFGTWVLAGTNNITVSGSTGGAGSHTLWLSVPSQSVQTQNLHALVVSNNTSGATTIGTSGTISFAGTNITITANTANNSIIGFSVAAPGAAAEANWIELSGNTAGNTTASGSTIRWIAGNNITLSGLNNSQVRIDAGGGGGATLSNFQPMENIFSSIGTIPQGSCSIRPIYIPFNVTATYMRFAVSQNVATQTNNSSAGQNLSINLGIYTLNGSTLSRVVSGSALIYASYSSNATGSVTGMKQLTVPINLNLAPGEYWIGLAVSTQTSGQTSLAQTRTLYGNDRIPTTAQAINIGNIGQGTATIRPAYQFLGIYTAATSACPAAISSGDVNVTSASNPARANYWFEMRNNNLW